MTSLERLAAIGFGARLTKAQTADDAAEIARLRRRVSQLEGRLATALRFAHSWRPMFLRGIEYQVNRGRVWSSRRTGEKR